VVVKISPESLEKEKKVSCRLGSVAIFGKVGTIVGEDAGERVLVK
jgi:hypothetical protein